MIKVKSSLLTHSHLLGHKTFWEPLHRPKLIPYLFSKTICGGHQESSFCCFLQSPIPSCNAQALSPELQVEISHFFPSLLPFPALCLAVDFLSLLSEHHLHHCWAALLPLSAPNIPEMSECKKLCFNMFGEVLPAVYPMFILGRVDLVIEGSGACLNSL